MYQVQRYQDEDRYMVVLVRKAYKYFHLTFIEADGIRHKTIPLESEKLLFPLMFKNKPYPVARAVKQMRAIGKVKGITEAAKSELAMAMEEEKEVA